MKAILNGIYSRFTGNQSDNFYTALAGRFYLHEAPQNSTYPYGVFSLVSEVPQTFFDNSTIETATLQIDLYDQERSPSDLMDLEVYCDTFFNSCSLTITGYTHLKMIRELSMLMREEEDNIWRIMQQYEVMAHKA